MCEYTTYQVAREAGIHTNTVRLYEAWKYISEVPRRKNGYRVFSRIHMEQVLLVRKLLLFTWISGEIRNTALEIIHFSAQKKFDNALKQNLHLQKIIRKELKRAVEAIHIAESWYRKEKTETNNFPVHISKASKMAGITSDTLRHWERNRLLKIPRDKNNGYRIIGDAEIERLKIIRVLRQSGYSIMSILRMLSALDNHSSKNVRKLLDTPSKNEDVIFATDKWMSKLKELYCTTQQVNDQLNMLI
jgi:DNA-binding transcriptional MerR regulator